MLSGAGTWVCGEQMLAKSSGCGSTGGTGTQAPCWLCHSLARDRGKGGLGMERLLGGEAEAQERFRQTQGCAPFLES